MNENEEKLGNDEEEEVPQDEESFADESLLSFIELGPEEGTGETPPEPLIDTDPTPGGVTVDEVLADRPHLEIDTSSIRSETPSPPGKEPDKAETPVAEEAPEPEKRPLEVRSKTYGDEEWKVGKADDPERDARLRASKLQVHEHDREEKVKVDHERLAKLDDELKGELERLREKALEGVIPGEFLEARRRLADEGILECAKCKVRVPDRPGKIDYCPKCGLALDDYFGEYRAEWERKYKHRRSWGLKEFDIKKPERGTTRWEEWKEEKGVDPEAELLICPECGTGKYDDPFVADRCPSCGIPLDLHLQFPRDHVRKREASTKGRRYGSLKNDISKGKKKKK